MVKGAVCSKSIPPSVVGIASLWLCYRISFYRVLLENSENLFVLSFSLYLAVTIVFVAVLSVANQKFEQYLFSRVSALSSVALLLGLGFLVSLLSEALPQCAPALGMVGACMAGAGGACALMAWLLLLKKQPLQTAVVVIVLAFLANMLVACGMSFLNSNILRGIFVILPFVSVICWIMASRPFRLGLANGEDREIASNDAVGHARSYAAKSLDGCFSSPSLPEPITRQTCILVTIFIYAGAILWGFLPPEEVGVVTLPQHLLTFFVAGAVFAFVFVSVKRFGKPRPFLKTMRAVLLILFFVALFTVLLLGTETTHYATSTLMAARFCLEAFSWIVMLGVAAKEERFSTRLFGAGLVVLMLVPSLLGNVVFPFLFKSIGLPAFSGDGNIAIVVSTFILVVATILFLNSDAHSETIVKDLSSACAEIAQKRGLTPREAEVLELLAQGNSQKKISDILYIAPTTVQTHTKAVYRKLDVRSKQELIDLIHGS